MGVTNIFSKRQKVLRGEVPDVYTYDIIPNPLRVQIVQIWVSTLGNESEANNDNHQAGRAYQHIVEVLRKEYGVFTLPSFDPNKRYGNLHFTELINFFLNERDAERVLDAVELSFRVIDHLARKVEYLYRQNASKLADAAIQELNTRLREHGVGYVYENGEILRVDSQLLHAEVVKPALSLLTVTMYAGAQEEFLRAHGHYRHERTKEALNECLKALESTMKAICEKRKWSHKPTATASQLIEVLVNNGLIPAFWTQHFSALRGTLEAGVPTVRNKLGGHGQGSEVVSVPSHIVGYALHQAASAIVFLAEAEKALP